MGLRSFVLPIGFHQTRFSHGLQAGRRKKWSEGGIPIREKCEPWFAEGRRWFTKEAMPHQPRCDLLQEAVMGKASLTISPKRLWLRKISAWTIAQKLSPFSY